MSKEFKYINLAQFKVSEEGTGSLDGYPTPWDEIDESGDLIPRGAYVDTIPSFLERGFGAHSHDWSFSESIGYPMEAKEDDQGFWFNLKFHSTEDAQKVRTKVRERKEDGKFVGLSIGFQASTPPIHILPKDYEKELPKYVSPSSVARVLERAKQFARVRILLKVDLFEVSIVTAPMNRAAGVTGVKSAVKDSTISVKGMFEERLEERTNSLHNLYETLCFIFYQLQYMASAAECGGTTLDAEALLDEALAEFTARVRSAVISKLESGDSMDAYYYYGRESSESKIDKFLSVKSNPASGLTLAERSDIAASASEEFAQRSAALSQALKGWAEDCKSKQEARTKEGRTISSATATRIEQAKAKIDEAAPALSEVSTALSDLLEMANPKEKAANADELRELASGFLKTHLGRIQVSA